MNRDEIAWAAGFFDGEGTTYLNVTARGKQARVTIAQNDPEVLLRFRDAIGGLGRVHGPYVRSRPDRTINNPFWVYHLTPWREVQAGLAMLWRFLSTAKRAQALRVLREARGGMPNRPNRP